MVPVIAKSDSITKDELADFKQLVSTSMHTLHACHSPSAQLNEEFAANGIKIYVPDHEPVSAAVYKVQLSSHFHCVAHPWTETAAFCCDRQPRENNRERQAAACAPVPLGHRRRSVEHMPVNVM